MKRFDRVIIAGLLCMSLLTGCTQKISQNVNVMEKNPLHELVKEEQPKLTVEEQREAYLNALSEAVTAGGLSIDMKDYTLEECKDLVNQFYNDNPQFFWLTGGFEYSELNGDITLTLDSLYDDVDERKARLEEAAAPIIAYASTLESDYDKALYVHDTLCDMITYTHSEDESDQNIYSALVDQHCVCSGYARSYKYLLNQLGIEAFILTGQAEGESHAWNGVYLNGELYYVDVTWDDVDGENSVHCYGLFGMNSEQMNQIYTVEYPQEISDTYAESCNYYKRNGWYLRNCDEDELIAILASQSSNNPLRLQCADKDVYNWVLELLGEQRIYEIFNFAGIWAGGINYFYRDSANEFVIEWN